MKLMLSAAVALSTVMSSQAAFAQSAGKVYFPVKKGNEWTFERSGAAGSGATSTVAVTGHSWWTYTLSSFPGFPGGAKVKFSGNSMFVWDVDNTSWRKLLRFSAPDATVYAVAIGTGLWQNSEITVAKNLSATAPLLGRTFTNCIRFTVVNPTLADAGIQSMTFAPTFGLVEWTEQSIAGPVVWNLRSASVNGKKLGSIGFSVLETSAQTSYVASQPNKVLLINNKAQWEKFYKDHRPGQAVPSVDFKTSTVLVALAGQRPTPGYDVSVQSVTWNASGGGATAAVRETTPSGPVIAVLTSPCQIVVLNRKAYTITTSWTVVPN